MQNTLDLRQLTELDAARIRAWVARLARADAPRADPHGALEIVDDAQLAPSAEIPPDTVTMYSQVLLELAEGGTQRVALCYPPDVDPAEGFISVLSPLGLALIGRSVGDTVRWARPDGTTAQARIASIPFQPEASGDYSL